MKILQNKSFKNFALKHLKKENILKIKTTKKMEGKGQGI